jgi:hypothetical protein
MEDLITQSELDRLSREGFSVYPVHQVNDLKKQLLAQQGVIEVLRSALRDNAKLVHATLCAGVCVDACRDARIAMETT